MHTKHTPASSPVCTHAYAHNHACFVAHARLHRLLCSTQPAACCLAHMRSVCLPHARAHAQFMDMLSRAPRVPCWKWSISFGAVRTGLIPCRVGLLLLSAHGGNWVPVADSPHMRTSPLSHWQMLAQVLGRWPQTRGSLKPLCHHHLPATTPLLHTHRKGKLRHNAFLNSSFPARSTEPQSGLWHSMEQGRQRIGQRE